MEQPLADDAPPTPAGDAPAAAPDEAPTNGGDAEGGARVDDDELPPQSLAEAWREVHWPVLALALCFAVAQLAGMALVPTFDGAGMQATEDPDDPANSAYYIFLILAFTGVVLLIVKYKQDWLLHAIFLAAIGMTFAYVVYPVAWWFGLDGTPGGAVAVVVAAALTAALRLYPEWYIVDLAGVILAAGVAAIFGISFGLVPALVLLTGLAIYDAWAVYHTGHMVDMADSVMELRLPILLVMPKHRGYSFRRQARLKAQLESGDEREAMFMGLGDLVIPGTLIVSAKATLGWAVGLGALVGGLAGFAALMVFVLRGKPQAGLPLLNGGTILGYAIAALLFAGELGVWGY